MYTPAHGTVDHSSHGSSQRTPGRGFTASYGWASGNPHHVPRFHMSGFQRNVPRVDQKYGENAVVRAPYANDSSVNDAPVHNHKANSVPQFHMSCYERPANVVTHRDGPNPITAFTRDTVGEAPVRPGRRCHAWLDGSTSAEMNSTMHSFQSGGVHDKPTGTFQPCGSDSAHVPHAAPPQPWASGYDSSLSKRRNHDSELSSVTPRLTTAAQGKMSAARAVGPTSPTTGGQEHGGQTKKSHSSPMGHQGWASTWDSSLCRKWDSSGAAQKYTSNVAALIHGGE